MNKWREGGGGGGGGGGKGSGERDIILHNNCRNTAYAWKAHATTRRSTRASSPRTRKGRARPRTRFVTIWDESEERNKKKQKKKKTKEYVSFISFVLYLLGIPRCATSWRCDS
jgi:hypothetical protein